MPNRDEVFQPQPRPGGDDEVLHHREAAEDGAGDEVGRKDRRVPARELRDGEVEGYDGVDREHQRHREGGQQLVGFFVGHPMTGRTAPTERQSTIEKAPNLVGGAIAQAGEVGDEARVPKEG